MSTLGRVEKAQRVAKAALDLKAENPVILDVREVTEIADTFVVLSGGSDRHVRAIADAIAAELRAHGEQPFGIEGYAEGRWILIDCSDLIVHVFLPDVRDRYDLERLWSDASPIDVDPPADPARSSASGAGA